MQSVRARETETYEELMGAVSQYSDVSPGEQMLPAFLDMAHIAEPEHFSVLDAGCSSGKAAVALHKLGFRVTMSDLTPVGLVDEATPLLFERMCLWDQPARPQKWDFVFCADVLEHIPPAFTMLTVARLLERAQLGVFLSIALQPDNFGAWVGKPLHQTVMPFMEWKTHLAELGDIRECRDLLTNGLFYLEPKS